MSKYQLSFLASWISLLKFDINSVYYLDKISFIVINVCE
jgi:hypothetical protein